MNTRHLESDGVEQISSHGRSSPELQASLSPREVGSGSSKEREGGTGDALRS